MTNTLEIRAESHIEGDTLYGIAHTYGTRYRLLSGLVEEFRAGSFDKALEGANVRAFYQHNPQMPLGSIKAGTLRLRSTSKGLEYEIDLPRTSYVDDLKTLLARKEIGGMSVGFKPGQVEHRSEGGVSIRSHIAVKQLIEISPVTMPAFEGTTINVRGEIEIDGRTQLIIARYKLTKGA